MRSLDPGTGEWTGSAVALSPFSETAIEKRLEDSLLDEEELILMNIIDQSSIGHGITEEGKVYGETWTIVEFTLHVTLPDEEPFEYQGWEIFHDDLVRWAVPTAQPKVIGAREALRAAGEAQGGGNLVDYRPHAATDPLGVVLDVSEPVSMNGYRATGPDGRGPWFKALPSGLVFPEYCPFTSVGVAYTYPVAGANDAPHVFKIGAGGIRRESIPVDDEGSAGGVSRHGVVHGERWRNNPAIHDGSRLWRKLPAAQGSLTWSELDLAESVGGLEEDEYLGASAFVSGEVEDGVTPERLLGHLHTDETTAEPVMLVKAELVPDWNRDGRIDSKDRRIASQDNPFRWWVNDDKDNGDYAEDEESDVPGQTDGNFSDDSINGATDLTDFFPIFLDIKHALEVLPPEKHTYKLRQADGALNFAESPDLIPDGDPDYDGAGAFWRSAFWAENYKNLPVQRIPATGVSLSHSFLDQLKNDRGILLLEYRQASEAPLDLEIWKGSQKLTTIALHAKIDAVEKMYRHVNLYEATGTQSNQLDNTDEPENYPDDKTNHKAFVMIHGYSPRGNGPENDNIQRGFQSEIFRRLHQAGSKAKYLAVYWDSATGLDYHRAVYQAFKTSPFVGPRLAFLAGSEITTGAHSLGNIVASNAICHEDFRSENYFLINAASPIEAYDPSQTTDGDGTVMKTAMTEKEWKPYDERFHSPNWHARFPVTDNRSKLKWKARFSNIKTYTTPFNFYSTGEDVVANPIHDDANLWDIIWEGFVQNQGIGRYSWVSQEFIKGGTSVAAAAFQRNHGGWQHIGPYGESPGHKGMGKGDPLHPPGVYSLYTAAQSNQNLANGLYTDEHLAQFTLFKRFDSPAYDALYAPTNDANNNWPDYGGFAWQNPHTPAQGSELAGQKDTQWVILATAMPSVSFAAAANVVENMDEFNMNEHKNGWPDLQQRDENFQEDWQHGDFVSIGATYVREMYAKSVSKGGLNED